MADDPQKMVTRRWTNAWAAWQSPMRSLGQQPSIFQDDACCCNLTRHNTAHYCRPSPESSQELGQNAGELLTGCVTISPFARDISRRPQEYKRLA
ncbi:unnamed protein product [Zymoseptoria tritici ST99CH_3D7]|uniref:Uncharacterized protein n=1 Tax=Zymoseptoria tritici (strain ST99CH_3D7) TaxID=1276538 RepID=A0A1X7RMH5_ZYMT9|nr:unnamed protein product [Zymoseptoria tritici ST99CH_3D7]